MVAAQRAAMTQCDSQHELPNLRRPAIISGMNRLRPSAGEIVRRGEAIYESRIRPLVETEHFGRYLVIDIETGEYEIDADLLAASDRAAAKHPGAPLYATPVGSRMLGRVRGLAEERVRVTRLSAMDTDIPLDPSAERVLPLEAAIATLILTFSPASPGTSW